MRSSDRSRSTPAWTGRRSARSRPRYRRSAAPAHSVPRRPRPRGHSLRRREPAGGRAWRAPRRPRPPARARTVRTVRRPGAGRSPVLRGLGDAGALELLHDLVGSHLLVALRVEQGRRLVLRHLAVLPLGGLSRGSLLLLLLLRLLPGLLLLLVLLPILSIALRLGLLLLAMLILLRLVLLVLVLLLLLLLLLLLELLLEIGHLLLHELVVELRVGVVRRRPDRPPVRHQRLGVEAERGLRIGRLGGLAEAVLRVADVVRDACRAGRIGVAPGNLLERAHRLRE